MKVRIGVGLGVRTELNGPAFGEVVDALESLHYDSLWLSERVSGPAPDPLVAMSFAAGRTTHLKIGMSVMVLPGRNPVILAKELATLDRMSNGRLLPAFGLGAVDPVEQQAFGVERGARAALFDESMAVLRGCWRPGPFTYHGDHFHFDELDVRPTPVREHLDVWLGGIAPSELRRVARLADGWLPSFITPDDARRGREVIDEHLVAAGRSIEHDHFGVLLPYAIGDVPEQLLAGLGARRPDLIDPGVLVPRGLDGLHAAIEQFVAVGTSKFVIVPVVEPSTPDAWIHHLEVLHPIVRELQT